MALSAASASLNALADRLLSTSSLLAHFSSSSTNTSTVFPFSTRISLSAGLTTLALLSGSWLLWDKHSWVAFGTGGQSPTWAGYFKANIKFRLLRFLKFESLRDVSGYSAKGPSYLALPPSSSTTSGSPGRLPERTTPRPAVNSWTLPQRQTAYQGNSTAEASVTKAKTEAVLARLHGLVAKYAAAHPTLLRKDRSVTEGGSTDAVFALRHAGNGGGNSEAYDRIIGGEIAHVHPQEHSLHVWLSEADAREVVTKGWGERFPLASLGMVHKGLTFVYAPVGEGELEVVEEIVRAGIRFVTGSKDL